MNLYPLADRTDRLFSRLSMVLAVLAGLGILLGLSVAVASFFIPSLTNVSDWWILIFVLWECFTFVGFAVSAMIASRQRRIACALAHFLPKTSADAKTSLAEAFMQRSESLDKEDLNRTVAHLYAQGYLDHLGGAVVVLTAKGLGRAHAMREAGLCRSL